jgi:hypothetical protein
MPLDLADEVTRRGYLILLLIALAEGNERIDGGRLIEELRQQRAIEALRGRRQRATGIRSSLPGVVPSVVSEAGCFIKPLCRRDYALRWRKFAPFPRSIE